VGEPWSIQWYLNRAFPEADKRVSLKLEPPKVGCRAISLGAEYLGAERKIVKIERRVIFDHHVTQRLVMVGYPRVVQIERYGRIRIDSDFCLKL
jgi:hypothetical protein